MGASASRVQFKFLMDTRVARESQLEKRSLSRELIPGSYLEKAATPQGYDIYLPTQRALVLKSGIFPKS